MGSHDRPVTRKRQTDRLVQAVHRVSGKHTGTTTATRTRMAFHLLDTLIAYRCIGRLNHRIDQIKMAAIQLTCLHRATGHEHRRDI